MAFGRSNGDDVAEDFQGCLLIFSGVKGTAVLRRRKGSKDANGNDNDEQAKHGIFLYRIRNRAEHIECLARPRPERIY
jgi:hypothetical protein